MTSDDLDSLPPQARFLARALARGLTMADVGDVLRLDRITVTKHLRTAARGLGISSPPPSAPESQLLQAVAPLLELAALPSSRPPTTRCPSGDVLAWLAAGDLDGPLMLAEADHVADCPACLTVLVELRSKETGNRNPADEGPADKSPAAGTPTRRGPVIAGIAIGLAAALAYVLLR